MPGKRRARVTAITLLAVFALAAVAAGPLRRRVSFALAVRRLVSAPAHVCSSCVRYRPSCDFDGARDALADFIELGRTDPDRVARYVGDQRPLACWPTMTVGALARRVCGLPVDPQGHPR